MIDLATTQRLHLRIDEFAELFGVSRRTVYNWRKGGGLPFVYIGQECRISVQVAKDLAAGRTQIPTRSRKIGQPVQGQAPPS